MSVGAAATGRQANRRHCLLALAAAGAALAGAARANTPPAGAHPTPGEVASQLPGARLHGQARLRFLGMSVYDARLWAGVRLQAADWAQHPLALELEYLRNLNGVQIAERSLAEMRKQADIAAADAERWLGAMKASFPDVRAGDRITGLLLPGRGVRFFVNGSPKGEIPEPEFARLFFGIWLSPRTSEPALRDALLGLERGTR
jgi:hypothetical protein